LADHARGLGHATTRVLVGAPLGAFLISPFLEEAAGGLLALMVAFALSSIPGAIIGYLVLKALGRTGYLG
jgi:predicted membrane protein